MHIKLNQYNYVVYLFGLYIYITKMIHGPYNVKLVFSYISPPKLCMHFSPVVLHGPVVTIKRAEELGALEVYLSLTEQKTCARQQKSHKRLQHMWERGVMLSCQNAAYVATTC